MSRQQVTALSTARLNLAASNLLEHAASDGGASICIAVVDAAGDLQILQRATDAPARTIRIATAKAYTALHMRMATSAFQARLRAEGLSLQDFVDPQFTSLPGGLPIFDDGTVIGGVGISGRRPDEDEALAARFVDGLRSASGPSFW